MHINQMTIPATSNRLAILKALKQFKQNVKYSNQITKDEERCWRWKR
jgi:hypothetical protein